MSIKEQVVSKDKYRSIFKLMCLSSFNILQCAGKNIYEQLTVYGAERVLLNVFCYGLMNEANISLLL